MSRNLRFLTAVLTAAGVLLVLSLYLRSWGGVALVVLGGAGIAWYRAQVARSEAGQDFFGDMGEETRLTNFQAGSASEMPVDRGIGDDLTQAPPPEGR